MCVYARGGDERVRRGGPGALPGRDEQGPPAGRSGRPEPARPVSPRRYYCQVLYKQFTSLSRVSLVVGEKPFQSELDFFGTDQCVSLDGPMFALGQVNG